MIDSIDISPDIAYMVVEELKIRGIKFIIAPYEADAQLAYLSRQ
jgi:exonuclease-1